MDRKKFLSMLLCSIIISAGIIIAALVVADRYGSQPMTGSFSGTLSTGSFAYSDLMESRALKDYLGFYPDQAEDYDAAQSRLTADIENNILSGKWPDFPYVQINGKLYFSKAAVDEWFLEKGKQHLVIK